MKKCLCNIYMTGIQSRGLFNHFQQTVVGGDDIYHTDHVVRTRRGKLFPDSNLNPRSNFDRELSNDSHRFFNSRVKAFVNEENPDILARKQKLIPLGLLQESLSIYPNIAVVPNNFVRQVQYEQQIAKEELDNPELIVVGGKQYLVQKRKVASEIANN